MIIDYHGWGCGVEHVTAFHSPCTPSWSSKLESFKYALDMRCEEYNRERQVLKQIHGSRLRTVCQKHERRMSNPQGGYASSRETNDLFIRIPEVIRR